MLKFKAIDLEDRDFIQGFLGDYPFMTYEYSFLTLYLWRKLCQAEYGVLQNTLIIKKNEEKTGPYFMQPIGYRQEDLPGIISELLAIQRDDPAMKTLFRDIEEPFLEKLKKIYENQLVYVEDSNNFDYIYETGKLIALPGEKLGKRKNQYEQFISHYDYVIKDVHDQGVAGECLVFSRQWLENQPVKYREIIFEMAGIEDILRGRDQLPVMGMAVYVQGQIIGFTIGEKVSRQMAVIHIEKADAGYKGIYAFINKTFAEKYLADTQYINREEDQGITGLRKAKRAYDPCRFEMKYVINIETR